MRKKSDSISFSQSEQIPVVDFLLKREKSRNIGSVSFVPDAAISGMINRYFVNRADRSRLINDALRNYITASGSVLHNDGTLVLPGQKEIDFEPFNEEPSV